MSCQKCYARILAQMSFEANVTNRVWGVWLCALAVVVGALGVRLALVDRFLPSLDEKDEAQYYIVVQNQAGYEDAGFIPSYYGGIWTPVYAYASAAVLRLYDLFTPYDWYLPSEHVFALRLTSVGWSVVTLVALMVAAQQVGGWSAALLAGAVWGFSPFVIEQEIIAKPDNYAYLFTALALMSSLIAWRANSPRWLFGALLCGILAIYSKYPTLVAVLPFIVTWCVIAWRVWMAKDSAIPQRRWMLWTGLYVFVALAGVATLFGIINPLGEGGRNREMETFINDGIAFLFSRERFYGNLRGMAYPISWAGLGGGLVAAIIGYGWAAMRRQSRRVAVGVVAMLAVGVIFAVAMASTFTVVRLEAGKLRHVLPGALFLITLWSVAVAQALWALADVRRWLQGAVTGGIIAAFVAVNAPYTLHLYQEFQKPFFTETVWDYTDSSLPREGLVWLHGYNQFVALWNRPWGGYPGNKAFEWWNEPAETLASQTPQQLAQRNITHLIFSNQDYALAMNTPQMDALLDQLMLVKTLTLTPIDLQYQPDLMDIDTAYVYRVLYPQAALDVPYGDAIRLIGYDLPNADALTPTTPIQLRLFWRADALPAANYSLFVHLYPADSDTLITQHDGAPLTPARPTLTWDDPNEVYIGEQITLTLPDALPAGDYRLAVGLYNFENGQRLPVGDVGDFYSIPITLNASG